MKKISYYRKENKERYITYQKENNSLSIEDVITHVNIGIDQPYYTNTKPSENLNTNLILVNKYNYVTQDYIPENLEPIDTAYARSGMQLVSEAKNAFEELSQNAKEDDMTILAMSSYRSYDYQVNLYNNYVETDGTITEINAQDADVGDILQVRPGDRIPLDGVIISGETMIDTSPVTGEPVPAAASPGSSVISGCVNTSGLIKMKVEKPLEESMVTRIMDSVENAAASKPKMDRFITRFSRVYTPFVVFLALATAVIPSLVTGNWNHWIYTALTFLVISCPCALVLSVPLAFFSGIGAGSKQGILFKGGIALETLKQIKSVIMDKTGTITKGNFQVQKICSFGSESRQDLLSLAAACEADSTHPIGKSILEASREEGVSYPAADSVKEIAGHGSVITIGDHQILAGNSKLMKRYHISGENPSPSDYGTEVLLARDGKLIGCIIISDTLKEDAKSAIQALKAQGLHTVMLTGDSAASAEAIARETGIDTVYSHLLPDEKVQKLKEERSKNGAVMFIGDGINDAPVLAGADCGAAMGSGADAAIEAADVVFMRSSVSAIPEAIRIGKKSCRIAWQNVVFALAVKILVMVLGLLGYANMWMAVFADTGVAMICIINSIRAMRVPKQTAEIE